MDIVTVTPWDIPEWDSYVHDHPAGTVYHTSAWCRLVADAGGYRPACLVARDGDAIAGLLPVMRIKSWLTGNRVTSLPFSDACPAITNNEKTAESLVGAAVALRESAGYRYYEMRGLPAMRDGAVLSRPEGFGEQPHFSNYVIPLTPDTEALKRTFARKAVRQSISKSERLGVGVREGTGDGDLDAYYSLYVMNRRRHGIPPQPRRFFASILAQLTSEPRARLYLAEFENQVVAALITLHYKGVTYAKYEGVNDAFRSALPIYPLFWKTIAEAAERGDRAYDFGRTADDNTGLGEFKSRWGTERSPMPYYFSPPGESMSVVRKDSLKYRVFTSVFRSLPHAINATLGARIFRHFG